MSRKPMRGKSALRTLLLLALLAAAGGVAWGWYDFSRFASAPLAGAGPDQSIDVARGSSLRGVVAQLQQRGATRAPARG